MHTQATGLMLACGQHCKYTALYEAAHDKGQTSMQCVKVQLDTELGLHVSDRQTHGSWLLTWTCQIGQQQLGQQKVCHRNSWWQTAFYGPVLTWQVSVFRLHMSSDLMRSIYTLAKQKHELERKRAEEELIG